MTDILGGIALISIFVLSGMGIAYTDVLFDKWECEKRLPRNVECTWQAPQQETNHEPE
jgi:hypothetical protein